MDRLMRPISRDVLRCSCCLKWNSLHISMPHDAPHCTACRAQEANGLRWAPRAVSDSPGTIVWVHEWWYLRTIQIHSIVAIINREDLQFWGYIIFYSFLDIFGPRLFPFAYGKDGFSNERLCKFFAVDHVPGNLVPHLAGAFSCFFAVGDAIWLVVIPGQQMLVFLGFGHSRSFQGHVG